MNCLYSEVCTNECNKLSCIRYLEMQNLLNESQIPESKQKFISLIPDDCDYNAFCELADIKSDIVNFVEHGENLYIVSRNTGNGKTTWSIKLMLKYFDSIWAGNGFNIRGLFIHVPTFLLKCKNFNVKDQEFEDLKSNLLKVDLVIWDDIGSTGLSNYDLTQLLMYIDQRLLSSKSNIFTGNLLATDLDKALGSRLASRVYNTSTVIQFNGKDKRH